MSEVTNTAIVCDDRAWTQAILPVKLGGVGVHSAVEVAPSAYLASLHASFALIQTILPVQLSSFTPISLADTLSSWSVSHDFMPPVSDCVCKQESWDQLRVVAAADKLLESAMDDIDKSMFAGITV